MKRRRRLFGVFLIIAALITMQLPGSEASAAAAASDFVIDGVKLTKYNGTATYVKVPDGVEVIAESAFSDNASIIQVQFSDSVKKVEPFAFWGCDKLQSIVLGKGITVIDDYAFANCKGLRSMTIPSGVTAIGVCSFMDCVNLSSIYIPDSVKGIHDSAFNGCYKLIIQNPEGSYASRYAAEFYERQKEMQEYEDVSNYRPDNNSGNTTDNNNTNNNNTNNNSTGNGNTGNNSSGNTSVQPSIDDPTAPVLGSTRVVGNQAVVFIDTDTVNVYSGANLNIPGNMELDSQSSGTDSTQPTDQIQSGPETQTPLPPNPDAIPKSRIVNGTIVADQAYYRAQGLGNVMVPAGIIEIGEFAYARSDIRTVTVPEGVQEIGYGAFYHCDELKSVRLPDSIENISPKAFQYTAIVSDFLTQDTGLGDFLISGSSLIAYRGTSPEVTIPEGVKLIAGEVFKDHAEIEKVNLPQRLEVICEGAFEGCSSLREVNFGNEVTAVKDRAFSGCGLSAVYLPASLRTLGLYVFDDNVSVNLSAAVTFTHEASAERLSNESYRRVTDTSAYGGVTVTGVEGVMARLEGAQRRYTLTITSNSNTGNFLAVYRNTMGKEFPADCPIYEMNLTDSSGIPITRLGKQFLYVTIPLSDEFEGIKASVVTLDRNGQLESVASDRVIMNGKDCIRIVTSHLSHFGIVKGEEELDPDTVLTVSNEIRQGAAPVQNAQIFPFNRIKLLAAGILFLAGVILIFKSTKLFIK